MKGRASTDQIQVILNSLAGAGIDIASRSNLASVVWDVATGAYKHVVITGNPGVDGKEVEMQKTPTHIQYRHVGDVSWVNLVQLTDITGPSGPNIVQTGTQTNITGLLKGDGTGILRAIPGEDYVLPNDPRFSNLGTSTLTYPLEMNETILKGKVAQLMASGKIEGVKQSTVAQAFPAGTINNFFDANDGYSAEMILKVDPRNPNRFVVLRTWGGSRVYCAVGTVNHTTNAVTIGSWVNLVLNDYTGSYGYGPQLEIDPFNADKFFICFQQASNYCGIFAHCSMTGNTPSLLMTNYFYGNMTYGFVACYDRRTANKIVILYADYNSYPYAVVGTISGSTFSFGTALLLQSFQVYIKDIAANPLVDNSFLVSYIRTSNVYGYIDHLSVNATVVTRSTSTNTPATTSSCQIAFSPFTKGEFLIFTSPTTNNYYGTVIKCALSDAFAVTFGAQYVFASQNMSTSTGQQNHIIEYDRVNKANFLMVFPGSGTNFYVRRGIITGELVSFESLIQITGPATTSCSTFPFSVFTTEGKFLYCYYYYSSYNKYNLAVGQFSIITSNIDKNKMLGIVQKDGDANNVRDVLIKGIDQTMTGLTIGSSYYVQANGTISTTVLADSVLLGIALSPTKLLIR